MLDELRKRRSIRAYTKQPISETDLAALKETCVRAPSSRNLNPWRFIFVREAGLLEELSRAKPHGAEFLKEAALGIVICADEARCDVWIEDCSIAGILAQMTAVELGLGSCWIQIRNRQYDQSISAEAYVRNVLQLPAHLRVACIIAVGHPAEHQPPLSREDLPDDVIEER